MVCCLYSNTMSNANLYSRKHERAEWQKEVFESAVDETPIFRIASVYLSSLPIQLQHLLMNGAYSMFGDDAWTMVDNIVNIHYTDTLRSSGNPLHVFTLLALQYAHSRVCDSCRHFVDFDITTYVFPTTRQWNTWSNYIALWKMIAVHAKFTIELWMDDVISGQDQEMPDAAAIDLAEASQELGEMLSMHH
jgi:hypothetical protein